MTDRQVQLAVAGLAGVTAANAVGGPLQPAMAVVGVGLIGLGARLA
jgi:hypothetical protein